MKNEGSNLLFLKGDEIDALLQGREQEILKAVGAAYQTHANGNTHMPPNGYLKFPNMEKERIIAKPAYLGGDFNVAGIKWIASFPGNIDRNIERASATLILNSVETGHPTAIMESSIISACRTAASAALAAGYLNTRENVSEVGLVGCGLINYQTLRFLLAVFPNIDSVCLYDLSAERAGQFKQKALELNPKLKFLVVNDLSEMLERSPVISLATTAVVPHVTSLEGHLPNAVILHISLRDLVPEIILRADNVVDDIDQVCSNKTSLHLAEQQVNNRNFIRTTIGDILNGEAKPSDPEKHLHIFSPFGLGILDLAVAHLIQSLALQKNAGMYIESFLPKPWLQ